MSSGFNVTAFLLFVIVGALVLDHLWAAGLVVLVLLAGASVWVARSRR